MHLPTVKMVYTAISAVVAVVIALFSYGGRRHSVEAPCEAKEPAVELLVISPQPLKPETVLEPFEENIPKVKELAVDIPQTVTRKIRVSMRVSEPIEEIQGRMVAGYNLRERK